MNYVFWQFNLYTSTSLAQMLCFNKEIVNISFLDHNDNKKYLNVFFQNTLLQLFACTQLIHWYIEQTNTFATWTS